MTPIRARARACVSNACSADDDEDEYDCDIVAGRAVAVDDDRVLPEEGGEEAATVSKNGTARSVRSAAESRRCAHSSISAHARSCSGSRDNDDGVVESDEDDDADKDDGDIAFDDDASERKWAHKNVSENTKASDARSAAEVSSEEGAA